MNDSTLQIQSKLPEVGTTIFAVMSQMAAQAGAINLSQGFPDFSPPERLRDLVTEYMAKGMNQYAPMTGLPMLRQRIAEKTLAMYGATVDMDSEINVTTGATEALFSTIQALAGKGDEVILLDPAYDAYDPAITLAGGKAVHVPLTFPDYGIDWQKLSDAINPRTRAIVVNSPHNPTGSVLAREDLDRLAELTRDTGILFISDEVYEHMVFDGRKHHSFIGHDELRARSVVISSFGKTYHNTGWKVGYAIAPPPLMVEFRKVHQYVNFSTSTPFQCAIADFMEDPSHHLELPDFYQAKRDRFREGVTDSRFDLLGCPGTYFQLLGYERISDKPDTEMAEWLTKEVGVAAIPISVFYADKADRRVLRFCFAKDGNTLDKATALLSQI